MLPVLGGEVVERQQDVAVLGQAGRGLVVLRPVGFQEEVEGALGKVADGWYVGTNYSKKDVARILGRICDVAGLVLGDDLSGPAIKDIKSHAQ